jgi:hypothetical protein
LDAGFWEDEDDLRFLEDAGIRGQLAADVKRRLGAYFPVEKEEVAPTAVSNGAPQEDMLTQIRNAH